jgi:type III restriction enzyme
MSETFFSKPILNSPYAYPARHWELDESGQPTNRIVESRRRAAYLTPIPKPKKQKHGQAELDLQRDRISTEKQKYDPTPIINELRAHVDRWRTLPSSQWNVTPETSRLLEYWRKYEFGGVRPFFCQIEAVETAIWLTEVAPGARDGKKFLDYLSQTNNDANPGLARLALKLATGAGKTTVMAMIIAWQSVNAARRPNSKHFTRGFLVVTPGITIKDRLRVLQPNDPDSYYRSRELVPSEMLPDIDHAKIVITNYHAFKLRETLELAKGTRRLLQGHGPELETTETEGQMLQRVMPELMGMKNILAINDEAHHCYREKPDAAAEEEDLKGEEKEEAEKNKEAARLWVNGLEAVNRKLGLQRVFDLSATPFFLRGSGYAEGTLFPWTMSDFSLMDAIECGIVKLPRVPVVDNIPGAEVPVFRNLWEHIRREMPKKGRGKSGTLDPLKLPPKLQSALEALYDHYKKTFDLWTKEGVDVPPCFIVVCNNTSTSKLVFDFISGFVSDDENGGGKFQNGRFPLFRNFTDDGEPFPRPRTLLIDSEQLESGEGLDENFRKFATAEIEQFRREIVERTNDAQAGEKLTDQELLREVMNTVGKKGKLGESIRCVVSVSMLTEGWDANTVTHVLGVRAFGTQLLCEQVIGRALRRQSYELNEEKLFNVEYADVLGIPFDFTAKPVVAPPQPPRETINVRAISPDRDACEIRFPRVEGYRVELPEGRVTAQFTEDSKFVLTPDMFGATVTRNEGIIGEGVDLTLERARDERHSTIVYHLTRHLLVEKWRGAGEDIELYLFGQLKAIARQWLDGYLECKGDTFPGLLLYKEIADKACNKIMAAIVSSDAGTKPIKAILDPYNPVGSTMHVNFNTSKRTRWRTRIDRCHINWVITDSDWEMEFCRIVETQPRVRAYVKNHSLGFEVPYLRGSEPHRYRPDFIVLVDDGHGEGDLLRLVVEIKGFRGEDAKQKKEAMETYWIPGVNNRGDFGRWAFAELRDVWEMEKDFAKKLEESIDSMISRAAVAEPVAVS